MISEGFPQAQRVLCPLVRVRARAKDAEQLHGQSDSTGKWREPTLSMKSLSMRKLKEVLRLRFVLELGQRQIARSCSIEQGTVYEYLKRAQAAGVTTWSLPEGWDDRRLEEVLFGGTPRRAYESRKPTPDFARLHEELQRHPHLTLQLAWEEYRQAHPDGYADSRFCEL